MDQQAPPSKHGHLCGRSDTSHTKSIATAAFGPRTFIFTIEFSFRYSFAMQRFFKVLTE
jgi:hypothetical protein